MLLVMGEETAKASIAAEAWLILVMRIKIAVVAHVSMPRNSWSNICVYNRGGGRNIVRLQHNK
jgi:hypothetical protein